MKGKEEALVESARVKQDIENACFVINGVIGNSPMLWSSLAS